MMAALPASPRLHALAHTARYWREILALVLLLGAIGWIARTYIGDSTGPYGTCYATSGRAVPCAALHH